MEWLLSYVEGDTMIVEGIGVCLSVLKKSNICPAPSFLRSKRAIMAEKSTEFQ